MFLNQLHLIIIITIIIIQTVPTSITTQITVIIPHIPTILITQPPIPIILMIHPLLTVYLIISMETIESTLLALILLDVLAGIYLIKYFNILVFISFNIILKSINVKIKLFFLCFL